MKKYLTKEYFIYLFYRAIALAFMVIALNYFLFENSIVGNFLLNALFFVMAIIFTLLYTRLKPPLAECLKECDFWVSIIISIGNTIAYMGSFLFVVYMLSGRDVDMINLLYLLLIGMVFGTAYFLQCKKSLKE
jgi:predicted small integral membrane protein